MCIEGSKMYVSLAERMTALHEPFHFLKIRNKILKAFSIISMTLRTFVEGMVENIDWDIAVEAFRGVFLLLLPLLASTVGIKSARRFMSALSHIHKSL